LRTTISPSFVVERFRLARRGTRATIVIGFGVLAFSLVLARRVHQSAGSDDIDMIGPDGPAGVAKANR
jgi:hypothetical protein